MVGVNESKIILGYETNSLSSLFIFLFSLFKGIVVPLNQDMSKDIDWSLVILILLQIKSIISPFSSCLKSLYRKLSKSNTQVVILFPSELLNLY